VVAPWMATPLRSHCQVVELGTGSQAETDAVNVWPSVATPEITGFCVLLNEKLHTTGWVDVETLSAEIKVDFTPVMRTEILLPTYSY
jgi:hypothetical protein